MCYESDAETSQASNVAASSNHVSAPKPAVSTGSSSSTNCLASNGALPNNSSGPDSSNIWFHLQVTSNDKKWVINRTYENFRYLDKFLHDCIFDRKFSGLEEPSIAGILPYKLPCFNCSGKYPRNSKIVISVKPSFIGLYSQTEKSWMKKIEFYLSRFKIFKSQVVKL